MMRSYDDYIYISYKKMTESRFCKDTHEKLDNYMNYLSEKLEMSYSEKEQMYDLLMEVCTAFEKDGYYAGVRSGMGRAV